MTKVRSVAQPRHVAFAGDRWDEWNAEELRELVRLCFEAPAVDRLISPRLDLDEGAADLVRVLYTRPEGASREGLLTLLGRGGEPLAISTLDGRVYRARRAFRAVGVDHAVLRRGWGYVLSLWARAFIERG